MNEVALNEVALNLLANRTCDNCIHHANSMNIIRCRANDVASFTPKENTCLKWEEKKKHT